MAEFAKFSDQIPVVIVSRLLKLFLFSTFFLLQVLIYAQETTVDSLLKVLPTQSDTDQVKTLDMVCHVYLNRDNQKALEYAQKALTLAKKTKKQVLIAYENISVGNIYTSLGEYHTSLVYVLNALRIFEAEKYYRGAATASNVLGNIYLGQENYAKANEYYGQVVKYGTLLKNDYTISLGYMGMSNALVKTGDFSKSLRYLEKSENGFKRANRRMEYLAAIINKAGIYMDMKKYESAYETLRSCQKEVEETGDKYFISTVYTNLGNALAEMNRNDEGLVYYYKSMRVIKTLKADDDLKSVYLHLSQLYQKTHRPDSALKYLSGYAALKDSLFKAENLRIMNEMEAKFQNDKKNAEIKKQQAELQAREAKEKLRDAKQGEKDAQNAQRMYLLLGILLFVVVFLVFTYRNNLQKKKAYRELTAQKQIIEQKNKEILDSIEYARRIQRTLLASDSLLKKHLREHFIFYKPKDIVSGDFYWATEAINENGQTNFLMCTADCTGHGVPGAFMSLLCISFLNEITRDRKTIRPNEVFTRLKHEIVLSLNPEDAIHTRDGMDAVLCNFDFENLKLQMACANNPVLIVRKDEIIEIKPDKNPIGKNEQTGYDYTLHTFDLQKDDLVYTFTDGFADQFGGTSGKKFKFKQLRDMLFTNRHLSMMEQKKKLEATIETWKGSLEQLDDILVIGVRV